MELSRLLLLFERFKVAKCLVIELVTRIPGAVSKSELLEMKRIDFLSNLDISYIQYMYDD
jgi:hypothetical protein